MKRKEVGGARLGSGGKLTQSLSAYEMSTHDLSKAFRSSMATGTLVPTYVEFVQKGDVWEFDIESAIHTYPTNGPIFGNFKFQVDAFTADLRLYNKQLHNNTTGLGNKMNRVMFPQMRLNAKNPNIDGGELNIQQISPDSLLAYLGIRGIGTREEGLGENRGRVEVLRQAMPLLMYWDIYKEYYSNKQEEIGYCIGTEIESGEEPVIESITWYDPKNPGRFHELEKNWENWPEAGLRDMKNIYIPKGAHVTVRGQNLVRNSIKWSKLRNLGGGKGEVVETYIEEFLEGDPRQMWDEIYADENGSQIVYSGLRYETALMGEYTYPGETELIRNEKETAWEWDGTTTGTISGGIKLVEFPLNNIDDMRMNIFDQPVTSPLTIGYTEEENAVLPYIQTTGQTNVTGGAVNANSNMNSYYTMSGLGIKTYQSDRFNNWLNKTWIEEINDKSAVDVSSGNFTMDALNLAKKIYKLENRIAISGNTYQDWLEAVYGQDTHGAAEMPVYRGGYSCMISFDTVVSSSDATTAAGDDQPLGTLGGRGTTRHEKGGRLRFKAEEHCFVMIIASITPIIDYAQGNKWWTMLETMDDIHKPQFDGIGFQDLPIYEMAAWDTKVDAEGNEIHHSLGKQPSWTHYQTNQNEVYGNFARETKEAWMVLQRRYDWDEMGLLKDGTTYIDPVKYNYIFADTALSNQPFWVQIGFGAEARRIMSANQMPNL